jgi:Tol biopolymer transport system component/DNA-binding winged helix-turn-helix (wHTH) protein
MKPQESTQFGGESRLMDAIDAPPRLVRFEDFEVDLRSGELRKAGVKLKFGGQPFQVLAILLERPGELVTREELQKRLWPDTFVDVDHNLNTAINKIREVLGDSAENPRFVETLPRRGYRFIAAPQTPPSSPDPAEPVPVSRPPDSWFKDRRFKVGVGILAVLVLCVGPFVAMRWLRPIPPAEHGSESTSLNPVPFTALPGVETAPAFSPDGSRIAFAWNGGSAGKGFDVYVKAIGSETMLRLTHDPSESLGIAWSPDGTQIAFHRVNGAETGIYVVPALGGPERKLRSTRIPWANYTLVGRNDFVVITWSQDSKWIAFADVPPGEEHTRIYLLSTETLEARKISAASGCVGDGVPTFSHNGEFLAYWCFLQEDGGAVINVLPLQGGQPKTLSLFPSFQAYPIGLTWSADDQRLIFSVYSFKNYSNAELDEVDVANGTTKKLAFAGSATLPTISVRGDKLAYGSLSLSLSIWRRDLLHPESPALELVPSSRAQFDAEYSPDGKRIAFASVRSGLHGVWISNDDGSDLVQISNPHDVSGSPQWSPDGKRIAFDSFPQDRWEIYVADVNERKPRRLVTNLSDVIRPYWSHDGNWIYFRSNELGRMGVYRCRASGGDATAVSRDSDGINPRESSDGKTVYFASRSEKSTLMQKGVAAAPGTESEVLGLPRLNNASLWTLSPGGIYFVSTEQPARSVRYFDFASRQIRQVFKIDRDFGTGLSVSPDGRWMIYSQVDDVGSDIMLVDHFH